MNPLPFIFNSVEVKDFDDSSNGFSKSVENFEKVSEIVENVRLEGAQSEENEGCRIDAVDVHLPTNTETFFAAVERPLNQDPASAFNNNLKNPHCTLEEKTLLYNSICEHGKKITRFPNKKRNWLHFACEDGDAETLSKLSLVRYTDEFKQLDAEQNTPGMLAMRSRSLAVLELLVAEGLFFEFENPKVEAELLLSIVNGHLPFVSFMLRSHSYISEIENFLGVAVQAKQPKIINFILGLCPDCVEDLVLERLVLIYGHSSFFLSFIDAANGLLKQKLVKKWIERQADTSPEVVAIVQKIFSLSLEKGNESLKNVLGDLLAHYTRAILGAAMPWSEQVIDDIIQFAVAGAHPLKSFIYCLENPNKSAVGNLAIALSQFLTQQDLYETDADGVPLFTKAINGENIALIDIFIQRKVCPFLSFEYFANTPLIAACKKYQTSPDILSKLFELDSVRKHALYYVWYAGRNNSDLFNSNSVNLFNIIIKKGKQPCYYLELKINNYWDKERSYSLKDFFIDCKLDITAINPSSYHVEVFKFEELLEQLQVNEEKILTHDFYLSWYDEKGNSILHYLANAGRIDLVVDLIHRFHRILHIEARNHLGKTCLEIALENCFDKADSLIEMMIRKKYGCVVNDTINLKYNEGTLKSIEMILKGFDCIDYESRRIARKLLVTLIFSAINRFSIPEKNSFWGLLSNLFPKQGFCFTVSEAASILQLVSKIFPNLPDEGAETLKILIPFFPTKDVGNHRKNNLLSNIYSPPFIEESISWLLGLKLLTPCQEQYLKPLNGEAAEEVLQNEWKAYLGNSAGFAISVEGQVVKVKGGGGETLLNLADKFIRIKLSMAMHAHIQHLVLAYSNNTLNYDPNNLTVKPEIIFKNICLYYKDPSGRVILCKDLTQIHPTEWPKHLDAATDKLKQLLQDFKDISTPLQFTSLTFTIGDTLEVPANSLISQFIFHPPSGRYLWVVGTSTMNVRKTFTKESVKKIQHELSGAISGHVEINQCLFRDLKKLFETASATSRIKLMLHLKNNCDMISTQVKKSVPAHFHLFEKLQSYPQVAHQSTIQSLDFEKKTVSFYVDQLAFYQNVSFDELISKFEALSTVANPLVLPPSGPFYSLTEQMEAPLDLKVPFQLPFSNLLAEFDVHYHQVDKIQSRSKLSRFVNILEMKESVLGGDGTSINARMPLIQTVQKLLHLLPRQKLESKLSMLRGFIDSSNICLPGMQTEAEKWLRFFEGVTAATLAEPDKFIAKGLDTAREIAWNSFLFQKGCSQNINVHWLIHLGNSVKTDIPMALPAHLRAANPLDIFSGEAKDRFGEPAVFGREFKGRVAKLLIPTLIDLFYSFQKQKNADFLNMSAAFLLDLKKMVIQVHGSDKHKQLLVEFEHQQEKMNEISINKKVQERGWLEEQHHKLKATLKESYNRHTEVAETLKCVTEGTVTTKKRRLWGDSKLLDGKRVRLVKEGSAKSINISHHGEPLASLQMEKTRLDDELRDIFVLEQKMNGIDLDQTLKQKEESIKKNIEDLFNELNNNSEWLTWDEGFDYQIITPKAIRFYLSHRHIINYD